MPTEFITKPIASGVETFEIEEEKIKEEKKTSTKKIKRDLILNRHNPDGGIII